MWTGRSAEMDVATQRPLLTLAMILALSVALVGIIAVRHSLSWLAAAGTFYGIVALCQIAYLTLVVAFTRDGASERPMPGASRPPSIR